MHTNHVKHMLIGAGLVLSVLLLSGVSPGTALFYALLLACPLMMVGMVVMMVRGPVPRQTGRQQIPAEVAPHEARRSTVPSGRSDSTD